MQHSFQNAHLDLALLHEFFITKGTARSYAKFDVILRSDDEAPGVYYIDEGFVKVYSHTGQGDQYVHILYSKREVFPLIGLIGQQHGDISFQALSRCKLYYVPLDLFEAEIRNNAAFSFQVLQQTIFQFGNYSSRVENLEYKFASERLAYRLASLAERFSVKHRDGLWLKVPITHQTLGNAINLSRESVTRELDKLVKRDIIAYEGRQIIIKDLDRLIRQFKRHSDS
jgi:CRP-like cAMP-binding protein